MRVKVVVPGPLLHYTGNRKYVELSGSTIDEVLKALDETYPGIGDRVRDEQGKVRRYINIFVNEDDIRNLNAEKTRLRNGDQIYILPSVAGGTV